MTQALGLSQNETIPETYQYLDIFYQVSCSSKQEWHAKNIPAARNVKIGCTFVLGDMHFTSLGLLLYCPYMYYDVV